MFSVKRLTPSSMTTSTKFRESLPAACSSLAGSNYETRRGSDPDNH